MAVKDRRQILKSTLLDCAERIIATLGLPALRARDLAQEAGCAVGAIYNVFPDLDTLILEINLRTLAVFETYIERSLPRREGGARDSAMAIADLISLGNTYLAFASEHPNRWRALFQHRMADGRSPPDWYIEQQVRLFAYIETPLAVLCPDLPADQRQLLARTLFSATHGVVALGLDEKLLTLPAPVLKRQVELLVRATAVGLQQTRPGGNAAPSQKHLGVLTPSR